MEYDGILTEKDILILNTFKFFIFKNADYMKKLWGDTINGDDECKDLLLEGLILLRLWNSMIPRTRLIKPRWFRYTLVFPLQIKRLSQRYPGLAMKHISMEGLEHLHALIKNMMEQIEYNKLVDEGGGGCAMIMNELELCEDTFLSLGMDAASRKSFGGQKKKKSPEERMNNDGIRGRFFRENTGSLVICDECRARLRDHGNYNINYNSVNHCIHCDSVKGREDKNLLNNHYKKLKEDGKSDDVFITKLFQSYNQKTLEGVHKNMVKNNKVYD